MGLFDRFRKTSNESPSFSIKKKNNAELLKLIEQYRNFPSFQSLVDSIGFLDDIQNGRVQDNDITHTEKGDIKIHYQPDKSKPNHKTFVISTTKMANHLTLHAFQSNTQDLSTYTYHQISTSNLSTQIEERRILMQRDPHTLQTTQSDDFIRHKTDIEKIEHTRRNDTGGTILHGILDISNSSSDIASLTACITDDTELFHMTKQRPDWSLVKKKIKESVCKSGICSRINSNNNLRNFDIFASHSASTEYSEDEILSIEGHRRYSIDYTRIAINTAEEISSSSTSRYSSPIDISDR